MSDNEEEPLSVERQALRRTILLVAKALDPIVKSPEWQHVISIQEQLQNEAAHATLRGAEGTLDYWRGYYRGLSAVTSKINETMLAAEEIMAEEQERTLAERLKREILEHRAAATRENDVSEGLLGE